MSGRARSATRRSRRSAVAEVVGGVDLPAGGRMAPWVPARRTGARARDMVRGARVFAGFATLLVLTRRHVTAAH